LYGKSKLGHTFEKAPIRPWLQLVTIDPYTADLF
jgi:hypothetical protein